MDMLRDAVQVTRARPSKRRNGGSPTRRPRSPSRRPRSDESTSATSRLLGAENRLPASGSLPSAAPRQASA
jgi:hypothetical protein